MEKKFPMNSFLGGLNMKLGKHILVLVVTVLFGACSSQDHLSTSGNLGSINSSAGNFGTNCEDYPSVTVLSAPGRVVVDRDADSTPSRPAEPIRLLLNGLNTNFKYDVTGSLS